MNDILQSMRSHTELASPKSNPERILQWTLPCELPTCNDKLTVEKVEAALESAWDTALNVEERNEAKYDLHSVKEQQVETEPALEEANDSIATAIQEVIADEVKWQVRNAIAAILDMAEEAVEHLFHAGNPRALG